ncbi:hypothetical protein KY290_008131 [Solanum tuberosum]|uniref:RNase H family protein n=1 Tax=Solanum tuberosum TaxID=4113 RepID=A0ABQ7W806_SOLTU|nr:hypothetical protein KY290_008131 [Solanum tuberosum]
MTTSSRMNAQSALWQNRLGLSALTSLPVIPVHLDQDEKPLIHLGIHADSSSSGSDLLPDGGARDIAVDTSIIDELSLDHAQTTYVDDDQHTLEVVPELPVSTPAPTTPPTWHQNYYTSPNAALEYNIKSLGIHSDSTRAWIANVIRERHEAGRKKVTISRSSNEADYRSLAGLTTEVVWVSNLAKEFEIKIEGPISIYCDSMAAIQIAANPVFHERLSISR